MEIQSNRWQREIGPIGYNNIQTQDLLSVTGGLYTVSKYVRMSKDEAGARSGAHGRVEKLCM